MKVGSLFAGIGGFDLGFERAGFTVAWCVEWDKNAQAVLRARFPNANVYGDIREVDPDLLEPVDIVCGGFPCQDLSVAGKRAGLAGERSGLFHDAMRIVRRLNPRLLVLENVPGLLSSNRGLDFATVLREVGQGWDCAEVGWRVLDSQYFGVAQRRRRVFVVGGARAGCAEQVLALSEGSCGNPPSRGKARKAVAVDASRCADVGREFIYGGGSQDTSDTVTSKWHKGSGGPAGNETGLFVAHPFSPHGHYRYKDSDQSATLQDRENRQSGSTHLVAYRKSKRAQTASDDETWVDDGLANTLNGFDTGDTRTTHAVAHAFYSTGGTHGLEATPEVCPPLKIGSALGIPSPPAVCVTGDRTHALTSNGADAGEDGTGRGTPITVAMTFDWQAGGGGTDTSFRGKSRSYITDPPDRTRALTSCKTLAVATGMVVRRLTPVECERLQGFPDGWTDIGTDKPTADSHRYKQLGNAVTVNVAEWIARRAKTALESDQ